MSYGVSVMDQPDQNSFTYWVVMPLRPGAAVPEKMEALELPGGLYASCDVESLAQLGAAYNYLYLDWPKSQTAYTLDMQGMCLEIYRKDFSATGRLTIHCPLKTK